MTQPFYDANTRLVHKKHSYYCKLFVYVSCTFHYFYRDSIARIRDIVPCRMAQTWLQIFKARKKKFPLKNLHFHVKIYIILLTKKHRSTDQFKNLHFLFARLEKMSTTQRPFLSNPFKVKTRTVLS